MSSYPPSGWLFDDKDSSQVSTIAAEQAAFHPTAAASYEKILITGSSSHEPQIECEAWKLEKLQLKETVSNLEKRITKSTADHIVEYDILLDIAMSWRDIAFLFRDGHSDDISFSDACEAADDLERLINSKSTL